MQITSFGAPGLKAGVEGQLARLRKPDLLGLTQRVGVDSDALAPVGDLVTTLLERMNWFADIITVVSEVRPDSYGVATRPITEYRRIRMPRQLGASWTVFEV